MFIERSIRGTYVHVIPEVLYIDNKTCIIDLAVLRGRTTDSMFQADFMETRTEKKANELVYFL